MNPYEKTEQFLDLYKQFEKTGRKQFPDAPENAPVITRLANLPMLREFKDDIEYCRVVRNFLVHTPKIKGMYPVLPSDEMIEVLQRCINRVNNPIKTIDYSIKLANMFTATLNSKIVYVTDYMNKYGFTHVPVIDEQNRLIGVFSDNALYTFICEKGTIHITEETTLNEIVEYLPIYAHNQEYFAFMKTDSFLYEVIDIFKINVKSMKTLAGVFFNKTGKVNEPIEAMMTQYSLLRDFENYQSYIKNYLK